MRPLPDGGSYTPLIGTRPPTDILLVASNMGDGGTQRVTSILVDAWHARGHRVVVVTLHRGEDSYALPEGVERIRLRPPLLPRPSGPVGLAVRRVVRRGIYGYSHVAGIVLRLLPSVMLRTSGSLFHLVRSLRRLIAEADPAVIVALGGHTSVVTALARSERGPPLVISERNDPARQELSSPWNELRPLTYRWADVVTANSAGVIETLTKWVSRSQLRLVPNPVVMCDDGVAARPEGLGQHTFLVVGRLHEQKAHDVLLHAMALLPPHLDDWRLAIVGRGALEEELRILAVELGVADRVDWFGQVVDPAGFYRHASVFVLPSRFEGMPNAMLEAMTFGLPVVVSDSSPGPLEVVTHGESGLVVPTDDAAALAAALTAIASDDELRRTLGAEARRAVSPFGLGETLAVWDDAIRASGAILPVTQRR